MLGLIVLKAIYPELLVGTNTHKVDGEILRMHHMEHSLIIRHAFPFNTSALLAMSCCKHLLFFCTVAAGNCVAVIVIAQKDSKAIILTKRQSGPSQTA